MEKKKIQSNNPAIINYQNLEIGDILMDLRFNTKYQLESKPEYVSSSTMGYYVATLKNLETGKSKTEMINKKYYILWIKEK